MPGAGRLLPFEKILKLSDAYLEKMDNLILELSVKVININLPSNIQFWINADRCMNIPGSSSGSRSIYRQERARMRHLSLIIWRKKDRGRDSG